jgi:hypothetical protein
MDSGAFACADGWYLVDPPEGNGLGHQPLSSLAECSWSGQSGREKRDEQIKSLLVRDIGVVTSASQNDYAKRAKIYTFDPEGEGSRAEQRFRGVKLLCVHDKRRYTRKDGDGAESPAAARGTPPRQAARSPQTSKLQLKRPELHFSIDSSTSVESELGKMLTKLAYPCDEDALSALSELTSVSKRQRISPLANIGGRGPLLHLAAVTAAATEQFSTSISNRVDLCL